jgi:hypothetical protein
VNASMSTVRVRVCVGVCAREKRVRLPGPPPCVHAVLVCQGYVDLQHVVAVDPDGKHCTVRECFEKHAAPPAKLCVCCRWRWWRRGVLLLLWVSPSLLWLPCRSEAGRPGAHALVPSVRCISALTLSTGAWPNDCASDRRHDENYSLHAWWWCWS